MVYGGDEGRDDRYAVRRDRRYAPRDGGYANAGGVLRDPELRRWVIRSFDENRDGCIAQAEADQANVAFFRHADRNRDRRISVTEYSAARVRLTG